MENSGPMRLHSPQYRRFWILLVCLALFDAAKNEVSAASPASVGEKNQFIRARPCGQPIQYKIGKIDQRFGVDSGRVMAAAARAADLWNAAANAKELEYGTTASVTVELVYDSRQGLMQRYDDNAAIIRREEDRAEQIEEEAANLLSQMEAANAAQKAAQDDFGIRRDNYNARVDRLNDIGGGTRGQVRALDELRLQLDRQSSELQKKADELNNLNIKRNRLVEEHNALVDRINDMVASANRKFGKDIVAGLYIKSGNRATIEIFAFTDENDLVSTLAHEFGHALGLGHSGDPASIMGELRKNDGNMAGSSPSRVHLSPGDVDALTAICGRS